MSSVVSISDGCGQFICSCSFDHLFDLRGLKTVLDTDQMCIDVRIAHVVKMLGTINPTYVQQIHFDTVIVHKDSFFVTSQNLFAAVPEPFEIAQVKCHLVIPQSRFGQTGEKG